MANKNPNYSGMNKHNQKKKGATKERVLRAIDKKFNACERITVKSISEAANVSRTYLYQHLELIDKIRSMSGQASVKQISRLEEAKLKSKTKALQTQLTLVSDKYKRLKIANNTLRDENVSLKLYIEELTQKLNDLESAKNSKLRIVE